MSKQRFVLLLVAVVIAIVVGVRLCSSPMQSDNTADADNEFGNLMRVITNDTLPSVMLQYKGMDISFNPKTHIPNWVAWELTADETKGEEPRRSFMTDDVKGSATPDDYKFSGYDRGHMAPAADMKWDADAMQESFLMTNICPQAKSLNTGAWKKLEEKCRTWANIDKKIYIVCGPIYDNEGPIEYIGTSKVYVPKRFFKAIISPYANPPRGIGFIMPNSKVAGGMQKAVVTIDEIEAITGHDLFPTLPDDIENEIEAQNNFHYWSTLQQND